ncbi:MAG: NrfD/PsrC family molybdoenzyme membrane anchor subunit [Planctomycetota bacterium]|nr:NrfD/PsrC family molybdoenzyme membrane anchor subunit [Planctomycetota bacterium]
MIAIARGYITFLIRCFRLSFVGPAPYYLWMLGLSIVALLGLNAYCKQFVQGMGVTGMTDQVSWGLYIANFAFLVGVAAAAATMVIPVYVYRNRELAHLVIFAHLFAVAAIIMALLFVVVDLGRPDRFHHMMLRFNFPISMLTWDVISLNGYLVLNLHICGYLIYCAYNRREPSKLFYIPFVFVAIAWAFGTQLVEAFLYCGLGGRPFWNSAVIAPRLVAAAFAAGPSILIIILQVIAAFTDYRVNEKAYLTLRNTARVAMCASMFLLASEAFTEFYTDSAHVASARYLFFGLDGKNALVPWIWTSITLNVTALVILFTPLTRNTRFLNIACAMIIVGVWIEKGMGLVIPAFVPTPLGEIVEYRPTLNEWLVCAGIGAFGLLIFTILVRVTVPVLSGRLAFDTPYVAPDAATPRVPEASEPTTRTA